MIRSGRSARSQVSSAICAAEIKRSFPALVHRWLTEEVLEVDSRGRRPAGVLIWPGLIERVKACSDVEPRLCCRWPDVPPRQTPQDLTPNENHRMSGRDPPPLPSAAHTPSPSHFAPVRISHAKEGASATRSEINKVSCSICY